MIIFLTSSPSGPLDKPNYDHILDEKNDFVIHLKKYWKMNMKGLIISASPDEYESNDEMISFFNDAFCNSGVPFEHIDLWDNRSENISKESLFQYDFVMLAGGHVPTQNQYFHKIKLREMIQEYEGIVMGVSAGTMNSADVVYAQPEMTGESINPNYKRFIQGIGISDINVLPHYQMVKDYWLDGKRLFEDITYLDSYGNKFYALLDGSYILIDNHETILYGEAYIIQEGKIQKICDEGSNVRID